MAEIICDLPYKVTRRRTYHIRQLNQVIVSVRRPLQPLTRMVLESLLVGLALLNLIVKMASERSSLNSQILYFYPPPPRSWTCTNVTLSNASLKRTLRHCRRFRGLLSCGWRVLAMLLGGHFSSFKVLFYSIVKILP